MGWSVEKERHGDVDSEVCSAFRLETSDPNPRFQAERAFPLLSFLECGPLGAYSAFSSLVQHSFELLPAVEKNKV